MSESRTALSWSEAIREARARLAQAGVASPRTDADLLAMHVSGLSRTRLLIANGVPAQTLRAYRDLVQRRIDRQPLQHLTGTAAFWKGELAVGPGVFVPRPETELLVEWALGVIADIDSPLIIDACAGSGAIAWALAGERPDATIWAVEADPDAFEWLEHNLKGTTATGLCADATEFTTLSDLDGQVDLVVSNPPYVPETVEVSPEVLADPTMAVFAAHEGMAVINDLTFRAHQWLRPGGWFGCEHDDSHVRAVPALWRAVGFVEVTDHEDLAGRSRFTTGGLSPHTSTDEETPHL
ncbi:peptide chain release factor N(5)-glutamine methyltransferase [Natronoglycomyces albus]|uniref:Release factor glutamine methyltransferase n=1 Tax=Natronoglycomyces albus TaxID=2811108 RepID=A0A895XS54_9ACTN|nr:peptide chain release factor N(5)-glutamine methyltransferase [Natronoglycomyces albus]QSB06159.1 peptide chain release factor N(5)-glutamine methyltransferase [Natronoglycomyces albus]